MVKKILDELTTRLPSMTKYPGVLPLVGLGVSFAKTLQTHRLHRFHYDRRGWWINRQRDVTLFSPDLHTPTLDRLEAMVRDYWCHGTQLSPGSTVIDIGAGIGDEVVIFSRWVGPTGRVVAIEAHPVTVRCLKLAVEVNHLENTIVIEEAAADRETTLLMSDVLHHEQNAVVGAQGTLAVKARTVDDMLAPLDLPRIDLIKMNIEGAELMALSGMRRTLSRTRAIVVSCHDFLTSDDPDDPRRTKKDVIAMLGDAGFTTYTRPDAPMVFVRDYVYAHSA